MPDYKRFIAYFYEYIGGRRQRNAGFLKAECRGGMWRLQIQLRAGRWPEGGLQIYGYVDEGKRCPLILLGKAYAQKEYLTKRLQLEAAALASNGLPFENLSGIWIPCEEQRCYISHWLEGEIQPERLSLQEEPPAEEAKQPEKDVKSEEGASAGEDRTTEERPEADLKEQRPLEQEPAGQETEKLPEGEKAAELYAEEITEAAPEPERVPEKDPAEAARQEPEGNPAEESGREPERNPAEEPGREPERNQTEEAGQEPEGNQTEESGREPEEKQQNTPEKKIEQENGAGKIGKSRQADWGMLRKSRCPVNPFETEALSCIRICPRDILWLKQRGWPVGRNSFLMQGFWQFRHLVLAQDKAGTFFLCIPGQENENSRTYAEAFGFPEFRRGKASSEFSGSFGYWCRRVEG